MNSILQNTKTPFHKHRSGVALVVVLLVSALLLGVLLVITSNFAISSRRSTSEQGLILKARYAAESGINQAEARWYNDLSSASRLVTNLVVPVSEYKDTASFENQLRALCTNPAPSNQDYLCKTTDGKGNPSFFENHIPNNATAYNGESPQIFWARALGGTNQAETTIEETSTRSSVRVSNGFGLIGVRRLLNANNETTYIIELGATNNTLESIGQVQSGERILSTQTLQRKYATREIRITPFNLAGYALNASRMFDDRSGSNAPVFFSNQTTFDGPIHTNESFAMTGSPTFLSSVTSAGCSFDTANNCQNQRASLRVPTSAGGSSLQELTDTSSLNDIRNNNGYQGIVQPNFSEPNRVNFQSGVVEIQTESLETSAAQNGRLYIAANQSPNRLGNVTGASISIKATDANMQALNNDDWQGGTWNKDAVKYQYFVVTPQTVQGFKPCGGGNPSNGGGGGGLQIHRYKTTSKATATRTRYGKNASTNILAQAQQPNQDMCADIQEDESKKIEYRVLSDGTTLQQKISGTWVTTNNNFNGLIYIDGSADISGPERVNNLRDSAGNNIPITDGRSAAPAFAPFTKLAVATTKDANIYTDLTYADPPCSKANGNPSGGGECSAGQNLLNKKSVFGLYSIKGNINIINDNKDQSEENRTLHGSYLSANGRVGVDEYNTGRPLGNLNILGGINENYYGSFGTIAGSPPNLQTGYGRNLAFDPRFGMGIAPPFFPITNTQPPKIQMCEPGDVSACTLGNLVEAGAMRAVKATP